MIELLEAFSPLQIIMAAICTIIAVKGAWDLIDYFKAKYKEKFNKDYNKIKQTENIENLRKMCAEQHDENKKQYDKLADKLDEITDSLDDLKERVDDLTASDMHDIKESIVRNYHYFVERQQWIDDFSLNTLELRYDDYKKEGGNSYIEGLMTEIRKLPKHPPI